MFNKILIKNGEIFYQGEIVKKDIFLKNGKVIAIDNDLHIKNAKIIDASQLTVIPGLIDIHVHLREPGYSYKETIDTGTTAAAAGGFTTICSMPNTNPPIDSFFRLLKSRINLLFKSKIRVLPYSAITAGRLGKGDLVNFKKNSKLCFAFSDDGTGIQEEQLMKKAMEESLAVDKHIVAHCEDINLVKNGCIHLSEFSKQNNLPGISSESEYKQIIRDVNLAKMLDSKYHVCHISTKEGVECIRKANSPKISCEVTPHHLLLNSSQLIDSGEWKMNPPLRNTEDQNALIDGIKDGTIQVVASDHAPHSEKEKLRGLRNSAFGIPGLETSFPLLYTNLVAKKIISFGRLIDLMSLNPAKIFDLKSNEIVIGNKVDLTIVDLKNSQKIDQNKFFSKCKLTPFNGWECKGWPIYTICRGKIVYKK